HAVDGVAGTGQGAARDALAGMPGEKIAHDRFEAGMFGARVLVICQHGNLLAAARAAHQTETRVRAADVGSQQRLVGAAARRWHRLSCHFPHLDPSAHWMALVSVTLNVQRTTWPAEPVWPCDDNVVNT